MGERQCAHCAGTGWWLLDNSWFPSDGFRRTRCQVCKGSGQSNSYADETWTRHQRERRAQAPTLPLARGGV